MQKAISKLLGNKRGVGTNTVVSIIIGLILVTVLFLVAAELIPEAQTAGNTLNATGVPLGSLFTGDGVIFVIIMAAILLAVVFFFLGKKFLGKGMGK